MVKKNNSLWFPPLQTSMSYSQCMQALSDEDVFRGLLGYGLFAENIPNIFSSIAFMEFCEKMKPTFHKEGVDYIRYESIRNTNIVRMMGVPNPFAYFDLCTEIKKNWGKIQQHFYTQTINHSYKVSRIHVRKQQGTLKIFSMGYKPWILDDDPKPDLRIGARIVVHADISSFFPSICTHAIPWALEGKPDAKEKKVKWIHQLDLAVSRVKYGETNGILIGPHASHIISEIILTKVDNILMDSYSYQRNIDDYLAYVQSYDAAEQFIFDLRSELKKYDLLLNDKKTKVIYLPESIETEWTNRLKYETPVGVDDVLSYRDVQRFLDLVLSLMKNNNDDSAILKYALKILHKKKFNKGANICAQKFFLQMAVIYPYLYPYLDSLVFDTFRVDSVIIEAWCNEHFCYHYDRGNYEAIAYMLYYAIKYNFNIVDFSVEKLTNCPDCIVKTIGSLYFYKKFPRYKNIKRTIYDHAIHFYEIQEIANQFWLFWYTVLNENDLAIEWKQIKKHKISFVA